MVVAIDGPAGSGKSSTAKAVARRLGFMHLDTGAMYRAITLKALDHSIDHTDESRLKELVDTTSITFTGRVPAVTINLDGVDVTDAVRSDRVTKSVSDYCAPAVVRDALVALQRKLGRAESCVCEGRDIGTVVFPDADIKFFMVASVEARAERRRKDFLNLGVEKSIDELAAQIQERDRKDSSRANSPLKKADDAIELDTTDLTFEEQVDRIVALVRQKQNSEA